MIINKACKIESKVIISHANSRGRFVVGLHWIKMTSLPGSGSLWEVAESLL